MRAVVAGALVGLLLAGCSDEGGRVDQAQEQDAELRERPSYEQELARLTGVRDDVRAALTAELGLTAWSDLDNGNAAGCADFPGSGGRTAFVSTLGLTGGVSDEQWPQAVEVLTGVAQEAGFGEVDVVVDRPGQHEVVLRGERGSLMRFGTGANATLALESGCHLLASDLP